MPTRALRFVLPLRSIRWAGAAVGLVLLAGCAGPQLSTGGATGQLFARGLDEITDLYLEPVTSRRVAMSGAARLARLDNKLGVTDTHGTALTVSYDGRDIGFYALPGDSDSRQWGELVANLVAAAKQASPRIAAMPQETIEKAVFDGMTAALDRFSRYAAPQVARDQRAARDGFGGIGVVLDLESDNFRITSVSPNSPAASAGIRPEDRILAIDGIPTAGRPNEQVVHDLRGPVGTRLRVTVARAGVQTRELHLQRGFVSLPTVTVSRLGDIAVFRIASFNHSTAKRLAETLADAQRQSGGRLSGIVLDMRGNPGGLLDQAVSLADLFIHGGPIVSTVGRHPASRQYFAASGSSIAPQTPIVVLINGGSASAAEIVAAALQDAGRAVVIGSSSYGKGTVQTVLPLPNDGELTLTWARLVTPSGYMLQTHGVVPTVCTADLGDDERSLQVGLQRAGAAAPARQRAGLDERAWSDLRHSCPGRQTSPPIDLKLAERVLGDPRIYAQALRMLPAAPSVARAGAPAGPGTGRPAAALTGRDPALSSDLN